MISEKFADFPPKIAVPKVLNFVLEPAGFLGANDHDGSRGA
jgi:hypothetical protein